MVYNAKQKTFLDSISDAPRIEEYEFYQAIKFSKTLKAGLNWPATSHKTTQNGIIR